MIWRRVLCGLRFHLVTPKPFPSVDAGEFYQTRSVFPVCAVTRAQSCREFAQDRTAEKEVIAPLLDLPPSRDEWVRNQKEDLTLSGLWANVLSGSQIENVGQGYFLQEDMLVRKWVPCEADFVGEPVFQVVVPENFCHLVLKIAHDDSGHLGVKKTYDRVLHYFFWPKIKRDVSSYIKTCHTCQLTGSEVRLSNQPRFLLFQL